MNQNLSPELESDQKPAKEDASARWRKLIEQQRQSELSVSAWCRERGVSAASFFAWRRRLAGGASIFKPVKLVSNGRGVGGKSDSTIELCLRGGRRLRMRKGFDSGVLIDLVRTLEGIA